MLLSVSYSVHMEGTHVTITYDALEHRTYTHPPDTKHGTYPLLPGHQTWNIPPLLTSGGRHWRLFKLVHLRIYPHWYWHLVVATKTHTAGKRVVRILLEYILVNICLRRSALWDSPYLVKKDTFWECITILTSEVTVNYKMSPWIICTGNVTHTHAWLRER